MKSKPEIKSVRVAIGLGYRTVDIQGFKIPGMEEAATRCQRVSRTGLNSSAIGTTTANGKATKIVKQKASVARSATPSSLDS